MDNVTARENPEKSKETFLEAVVFAYLQASLDRLGDNNMSPYIKGKFPSLVYTTHGYDISDLTYGEKLWLLKILYGLNVDAKSSDVASQHLEKLILQVKDRLGVHATFDLLLKDLPFGVFPRDRVRTLSREDIEEEYFGLLDRLERVEEGLETTVAERTVELSAEKNKFAMALYNASDGVFALDMEGRVVTFNKVMEELTGYSFDEVKERFSDDVVRLFEDSLPLGVDKYAPVIGGRFTDKNVYSSSKVTLVARNGAKKYVKLISAAIAEGSRVNLRCIVTLADITKETELESMKLDFVSMAAHELRTPITAIRGYLSFLNDDIKSSLPDEHKQYLEKTIASANNLYTLMENLLNISRIETGNLVLDRQCIVWRDAIASLINRFKDSAASLQIALDFDYTTASPVKVMADGVMILEVLSNLIDNAVRYNKRGGGIQISFTQDDSYVVTQVRDTGLGIPQEAMPHVFKKFYRVSGPLTRGIKGTGLGLFISREIVRLHGGKIWAESELDRGSVFTFTLPVCHE
ncbi:PAS domain S-box protein [candidate division WWE3 bacterium]|nr:PAS domain S-box protein [candidate division WWE3 bacterium]